MVKCIQLFLRTAGVLLALAAVAKLVSADGTAKVLDISDPILSFSFRDVFAVVGLVELAIAVFCIVGSQIPIRVGLLVWFSTCLLIYRIGLNVVDFHKPCGCLGGLTDALHISQHGASRAVEIVLAYLLLGSYASALWLCAQRPKV